MFRICETFSKLCFIMPGSVEQVITVSTQQNYLPMMHALCVKHGFMLLCTVRMVCRNTVFFF